MKKTLLLLSILILFAELSLAQNVTLPSEGKSKIYFTRISNNGFLINFKIFDGEKYIGKFNGEQYMVYECDPGIHSFWALSENMSMVYAELEANKVYFIDCHPKMGAMKANVELRPLDKKDKKYQKTLTAAGKHIAKAEQKIMTSEEIKAEEKELTEEIKRGLRYVNALNNHNKKRPIITPDMYVDVN